MEFKVVRGNPTAEELAAALAVVRAQGSSSARRDGPARAARVWSDPARLATRPVPVPGAGAWHTTFWPR